MKFYDLSFVATINAMKRQDPILEAVLTHQKLKVSLRGTDRDVK